MTYASAALGLAFLVLLVWAAVILSSTPAGELAAELVYVLSRDVRVAALVVLGVLGLEAIQLGYPLLARLGVVEASVEVVDAIDLVQGGALLVAAARVLLVLLRYTHGGLERRIRDRIDTLAFLQGQRRRRRRA